MPAGRTPPTEVIDDDSTGSVETSGVFDPANDGIDFYESLEGMRVQVNDPVAVGPRNSFGEIPVLADDGAGAGLRTPRGGIIIQPGDFNPERIILDDVISPTPVVNVGDHFSAAAVGVMDYGFGNFKLQITAPLTGVSGNLPRESTTPAAPDQLAVATFNVENLDPGDGAAKFDTLAALIVDNLTSPDIIAIEEVQDNNGATNDAVVDASQTYTMLIEAIEAAGGPTYEFREIDPVDDQDGGEPGGNIRVGFLFRTDRGVTFVDRPGGTSTAAVAVVSGADGPELSFSPGRIDPTNAAFNNSRKPLAGEFDVQRAEAVRDRQSLQLEGRRRPALRALPAAHVRVGGAARAAGADRQRLRRLDPGARSRRQRHRARRLERLPVLGRDPDPQGRRACTT